MRLLRATAPCHPAPVLHVCSPTTFTFKRVLLCPNCQRRRRFVVERAVWYDPIFTCCHCGDAYCAEGRMPRPFAPGWRQRSSGRARRKWAEAPPNADVMVALRAAVLAEVHA